MFRYYYYLWRDDQTFIPSLAPRYGFYISNLTKVKYSFLTIFLHILSPLPVRTDQPNQREGHSKRQDFCKIHIVFMLIHISVRRESIYFIRFIPVFPKWTLPSLNLVKTNVLNRGLSQKIENDCRSWWDGLLSGSTLFAKKRFLVCRSEKVEKTDMHPTCILKNSHQRRKHAAPKNKHIDVFKALSHYENTPIQIYGEFRPTKTEKFQINKLWYISYFCSKHRLWVLVRTASARRF